MKFAMSHILGAAIIAGEMIHVGDLRERIQRGHRAAFTRIEETLPLLHTERA